MAKRDDIKDSGGIYKVALYHGDDKIIDSFISENFVLSFSADWEPTFAGSISNAASKGGVVGDVQNAFTALTGYVPRTKDMTRQYWQGNSPLEITIPFSLIAEKDPILEVIDPIKKITSLLLPSVANVTGLLVSPSGSQIDRFLNEEEPISLWIGTFFSLRKCVITGVSPTFDTIYDHLGTPLAATVDVSIRSLKAISVEDLVDLFYQTNKDS